MLSHYYDIKQADQFETLFGDLYIGKHPTPQRNSYLVLNLDFSGLDTGNAEYFRISFAGKIQDNVRRCLLEHRHLSPEIGELMKALDAERPGVRALEKVYDAAIVLGKKIYVIIDEYDHFANDLIAQGTNLSADFYRSVIQANGIVRDFYETLKEGSKTVIGRILLTGITPIMLDDMTSGFNISNNLSLKSKYNEMLGFTKEEVNRLMKEIGIDKSLINVDMELLYNGYLFHEDGKNRVYNPSMMLYLFMQILDFGKLTKNIIDENLKTDYSRLRYLVQTKKNREKLMEISQNNSLVSDIIPKFSIDQLHDSKNFVSLLYYMGLLTIDHPEVGGLRLKIPNYSIRTVYWEYIEELTIDRNKDVMIDLDIQRSAIWTLANQGNPHPYLDYVSRDIFSRLSNRDLENFNEKYIKIMLLNGLFQSRIYTTSTELEVSRGYTDIYMQRSHLFPDLPYEWVWELKYIKKEEAKKDGVKEAKQAEALAQLRKYRESHFFAGRNDVKFLAVLFLGKDLYEITEL
jgi:hypothetical protein